MNGTRPSAKLFVHSEKLEGQQALFYTRRPRAALRSAAGPASPAAARRYGGGAGRIRDGPPAVSGPARRRRAPSRPRSSSLMAPADGRWTPVMALRAHVSLKPGERARGQFRDRRGRIARDRALEIAERYSSASALDWAMEDGLRSAALEARRLGLDSRALSELQALSRDHRLSSPPTARPGSCASDASGPARAFGAWVCPAICRSWLVRIVEPCPCATSADRHPRTINGG